MIKGALIGFGQVAEKAHVPAWKESKDFQIVAVVDESQERTRLAAEYFPGIRAYASIEDLFRAETKLDFVDIATPPFLHGKQAQLALQHRCHVLCEKPLALVPKNFETLRAQAKSHEKTVFCVHNWKYAPIFLQAAQLLRSGAIGSIRHAELHTLRREPATDAGANSWRTNPQLSGGGILVDHGWHNFYLLHGLLGAEPKAVAARLTLPRFDGVEHEAICSIEFPETSAVLYLSWRAHKRANWGVFYGTEGTIELRDDLLLLDRKDAEPQKFEFAQKLSQGSAHPDWFQTMLEDFKTEIQKPKLRYQNLREAEVCLWLLTNVYQSHRLGGKSMALPRSGGGLVHA
ncbi:MAG: Gfo/Idh/MocA family oxidoreductase [Elusimicrobia bacterium]|nr:Gfo/Idh/MocA family oxidoreductase [Elusimicrobiota bacterium]